MAKLTVKQGSTSRLEHVFILDSTSTTGAGKTGLTNASITAFYFRPGDSSTTSPSRSITLSAGSLGTWSSGGFIQVSATDMPGLYEFGIPNTIFAAGANHAVVMIKGTGIVPVLLEYDLVAYDPQDTVRLGLTSIPSVAQGTTGSLPTGNATGQVTLAPTQTFNVTGNITGNLSGSVGSVTGSVGSVTGSVGSISTAGMTSLADTVLSRKLNMLGSISDVSVTSISSATFAGNNTYIAGDMVQFITTAPASFATNTKYYVISTSLSSTTFQLSATLGGSAITTASTGAFTVTPIDDRTVRSALRYLRNKVAISSVTMTTYLEDDVATAWTSTITGSPGTDPIVTSDPA